MKSLIDIYKSKKRIEVVDEKANLIAVFYCPNSAMRYLLSRRGKFVKLPLGSGAYQLYQCTSLNGRIKKVKTEAGRYKFN